MSSSDRSMLVEHVSQLSQPDCKFCLKKSHDPGHSDQSRLNMISSGGGYQGIMVTTGLQGIMVNTGFQAIMVTTVVISCSVSECLKVV